MQENGPFVNGVEQEVRDEDASDGQMLGVGGGDPIKRAPGFRVRIVSVVDTNKVRVWLEKDNGDGTKSYSLTKDFDEWKDALDYADLIKSPFSITDKLLKRTVEET